MCLTCRVDQSLRLPPTMRPAANVEGRPASPFPMSSPARIPAPDKIFRQPPGRQGQFRHAVSGRRRVLLDDLPQKLRAIEDVLLQRPPRRGRVAVSEGSQDLLLVGVLGQRIGHAAGVVTEEGPYLQ